MGSFHIRDQLRNRLYWLIRLRWIAIIGVFCTVFFVTRIFGLQLKVVPIYTITLLLVFCNLAYLIFFRRLKKKEPAEVFVISNRFANIQIFLDLAFLTGLIHFSGGIENPFTFYFIFHMIIASILLSRRASFLQASVAVISLSSVVMLEYKGILPHYPLEGFLPYDVYNNLLYISGELFVFATTLYIAVYMATSIAKILRKREKSLEEANALLSQKDRIKSEYVLRVSHNIKENLSAIESCIEPVTKFITGPLNDKQKDLLFRARERTGKLLFFVMALLEVTKIKLTRELKLEEFLFSEAIKGMLEDVNSRAAGKDITFDAHIDSSIGRIKGVRVYIEESLSNILVNSIKYTPAGGKVSFKAEDKGNRILIQIEDSGIGIPKDGLSHVFEEFFRAHNAKAVEKLGTGLGLSITKKIVELHKGKIWVESEENKGTIFSIELPK